jgi:hypothetical protein
MVFGQKQDPRVRAHPEDSAGRLDAIERRKADVQHDQIRSKPLGFVYCGKAVSGVADGLASKAAAENRRNVIAPDPVIVDNKDSNHRFRQSKRAHRGPHGAEGADKEGILADHAAPGDRGGTRRAGRLKPAGR